MDIRDELHEALDLEDFPSPTLLTQAMSRLDKPVLSRRHAWPAPLAAGLIAAALVVTLVIAHINGVTLNPADNRPNMPVSSNVTGLVTYRWVSSQVAWLNLFSAGGDAVIARTVDGGRTWHRELVLSGLSPTPTAQFFGSQEAVVIGQQGKFPSVWRTTDGGAHWQAGQVVVSSPPLGGWAVISGYFLDVERGWMVLVTTADCGMCGLITTALIYGTLDGGAHWSYLATLNHGTSNNRMNVSFATPSNGFVATQLGLSDSGTYATTDGGGTWSMLNLPDLPRGIFSANAPVFFSERSGVLIKSGGREVKLGVYQPVRYVYSTADGGLSWSNPQDVDVGGYLDFVSPTHWLLLGTDGLSVTTDAGATWSTSRAIPAPTSWYATQSQFIDDQRGWVTVSDNPNAVQVTANAYPLYGAATAWPKFEMLSTSDGGLKWHPVQLPQA